MNTGEVTSIVGNQVVVKASGQPPQIGTPVFSGKGRVGVVADIIGPLEKPYFVVKPSPDAKLKVGDGIRTN